MINLSRVAETAYDCTTLVPRTSGSSQSSPYTLDKGKHMDTVVLVTAITIAWLTFACASGVVIGKAIRVRDQR